MKRIITFGVVRKRSGGLSRTVSEGFMQTCKPLI